MISHTKELRLFVALSIELMQHLPDNAQFMVWKACSLALPRKDGLCVISTQMGAFAPRYLFLLPFIRQRCLTGMCTPGGEERLTRGS